MNKLSLTIFVILFSGLVADSVPVLIWGPHIRYTPAVALKYYDSYEFSSILEQYYTSDTITFVISEDELSVEDLSHCEASNSKTCFEGIQKIDSKLYFPSVEDPFSAIEDLAVDKVKPIQSLDLSKLHYDPGKYFFMNFDNSTDEINEGKSMKFTRHDRMITTFYTDVLSHNNDELKVVVIFTGRGGTYDGVYGEDEEADDARHKRAISEADFTLFSGNFTPNSNDSKTPIIELDVGYVWSTEHLLLFYTALDITADSEDQSIIVLNVTTLIPANEATNETTDNNGTHVSTGTDESNTEESSTYIIVRATVNDNETFEFYMRTERGYWMTDRFSYNNETLKSNRLISAADGFSFHCTPAIELSNENKSFAIVWRGLQLQPNLPYDSERMNITSFSDAYDCVGFVSPVILSGMLVAFLLLFIVFIGLSCIMDIKTYDRFDDPKKKTITVVVVDG